MRCTDCMQGSPEGALILPVLCIRQSLGEQADSLVPELEIDTEARNQLVHSASNQQQVQQVQQRLANLSTVPQQNVAAHGAQAAEQQNFAALGAGQQNVAAQQPSNAAIGAGQQNAASSVPLFSFTPIAGMPISQMGVQCEAAPAVDNTFHLSTAVPTAVPSAPQPQPHAQPQPQPVQQLAQEVAAAATVVATAGPGEAKTAAINAFTSSAQQLLNAAGRLHAVEPVSRAESAALHVEPTQVARSNVRVTLPVIKKWSSKDLLEGRDFDMFVTDIRRYASALNQELTETLLLHTTDDLRKVVGVKVSQAHSQGKAITTDEVIAYMKELIGYHLHDTKHTAMNRLVQGLVKQQPGQAVLEYAVAFRLEALKAAEVPQPILCDMFVRGLTPDLRHKCARDSDGLVWTDLNACIQYAAGKEAGMASTTKPVVAVAPDAQHNAVAALPKWNRGDRSSGRGGFSQRAFGARNAQGMSVSDDGRHIQNVDGSWREVGVAHKRSGDWTVDDILNSEDPDDPAATAEPAPRAEKPAPRAERRITPIPIPHFAEAPPQATARAPPRKERDFLPPRQERGTSSTAAHPPAPPQPRLRPNRQLEQDCPRCKHYKQTADQLHAVNRALEKEKDNLYALLKQHTTPQIPGAAAQPIVINTQPQPHPNTAFVVARRARKAARIQP
ncbi:hypothetical protein QJQ45_007340 [Haematococcus lacustris]|nr:hypothetical protein QJQ45_007340 [Haematococcus lacustris]